MKLIILYPTPPPVNTFRTIPMFFDIKINDYCYSEF